MVTCIAAQDRATRRDTPDAPTGPHIVSGFRLHVYRFGRSTLHSTFALDALPPCPGDPAPTGAAPAWSIDRLRPADAPPQPVPPAHVWPGPDGAPTLALFRDGERFRIAAPGADFLIDPGAHEVIAIVDDDIPAATLQHLLVDQVLPRCLAHEGELILHAAGIVVDGAVALFLGDSGQGKSTLSAALQGHGHQLLSDDCLQLLPETGTTHAWPTYPSLRLLPDMLASLFPGDQSHAPMAGYSDKRRLPVETPQPTPQGSRLRAIYLLEPPQPDTTDVIIEPVAPGTAVVAVTRNLFKLDPTDLPRATSLLATAAAVVRTTPVFGLRYPRVIAELPAHAAAIARHATGVAANPHGPTSS